MIRLVAVLFALTACTSCSLVAQERRLAEPDRDYRVQKLLVLPVMLTYRYCPADIDTKSRKKQLVLELTASAVDHLKTRGYQVAPLVLEPGMLEPNAAHDRDLGKVLCDGSTLDRLPPSVIDFAKQLAKPLNANQVLITGFSRLRWHLRMDMGEDNGATGENASEFDVRVVAGLYDIAQDRVVWSDYVDTKFFTGNYSDAIQRVLLFDQLRNHDPHEKLFYDFPLPEGAAAPRSSTAIRP